MLNKLSLLCFIIILSLSNSIFSASIRFSYGAKGGDSLFSYALDKREKAIDEISNSRRNIITETVKKVSPSVVGINVTELRQYNNPFGDFFNDPFFRQFFGNGGGTNTQQVKSLGSGYIISEDGYIVTNDHVAHNATEIYVTMTNGKRYKAKIVGTDQISDICLLKVEANNLPYLTLGNSDDIIIGEWAIALGNPFGLFDINDKPTVTVGVISATGMNLDPIDNRFYLNMIQTDASINGGNSGGPLVNSVGEIIGMNTIIYTAGGAQGSIGLGFAIPINKIKKIVAGLKENGKIDRDFYPGFTVQNIDEGIAKTSNLENAKGVIVLSVEKNTAASKAGLEVGDIILGVDNFRISNDISLVGVLNEYHANQVIKIKIQRGDENLTINYKLEKK
jgi:serine protease Do